VNELDIRESVHFVGPQFGTCKDATLRAAHAFILPSLSEGLPVAVLEAWSYGIPVLMTLECNLQEGFVAGAAIELQTETASIARALLSLFRMSAWERNDIGQRGQRLVKERFSCERIAAEMRAVYAWLLGAGSRPACVAIGGAGLP
jgi:glycosyltransferase involved in cell wall biosynthesis